MTLLPLEGLQSRLRALPTTGVPPIVVVDMGVAFRVVVSERVREYRDEGRDCANRARVAAVFVALTFNAGEPPMAAPQPPPVVAPPVATEVGPTYPRRLEVGASVNSGVAAGYRTPAVGATMRVVIGGNTFALVVGAEAPMPSDVAVEGVGLRLWRLPLDVGVRARSVRRPVDAFVEASAVATIVSVTGRDLAVTQTSRGTEIGARVAAGLTIPLVTDRLGLFIAVQAHLLPSPSTLLALPRGELGRTPYLWAGAIAGASLGF